MMGIYSASLQPYQSLKHTGAFESLSALGKAFDRCSAAAFASLIVRSWPNAIAASLSEAGRPGANPLAASTFGLFGQLRNLSIAVRDWTDKSARFALAASFDASAKPLLESTLGMLGAQAESRTVGKHK